MAIKPLLINDPIYGFIAIQSPLIKQLIDHPYFQRLRRITQMGLSVYVFPGAHHNRFEHALGCMHLAQKALASLCEKGVAISTEESEALQIALLSHLVLSFLHVNHLHTNLLIDERQKLF